MKPFLAAAFAAALAFPAGAEPLSPVKTAQLSAALYATGVEMGDPLLILSAAKLRKTLNPAKGSLLAEGATPVDDAPLGWEEMLASAETLAEGDDTLLGLIDDVRAESSKGVSSGPVYNIGALGNGGNDTYPVVEFVGGEYAEVYVEAKDATDLNLTVYDAQGRLVCSDTDKSHIAYCGWRPDQTGGFVMKVENNGPQGANYALMTN
ncbi:hypothetical protein [Tabrizicola fusiformis]|uniref:hypothetical protein n=1 Tax=Tabrizicola sp. SY72 TaxID=2741673 RepID=UPI001574E206|nr:hypothetical protein [Tabrizicola sp. SY72]NTT84698.1 hypothetical protein [Tabrizicola sp. SY72]